MSSQLVFPHGPYVEIRSKGKIMRGEVITASSLGAARLLNVNVSFMLLNRLPTWEAKVIAIDHENGLELKPDTKGELTESKD